MEETREIFGVIVDCVLKSEKLRDLLLKFYYEDSGFDICAELRSLGREAAEKTFPYYFHENKTLRMRGPI